MHASRRNFIPRQLISRPPRSRTARLAVANFPSDSESTTIQSLRIAVAAASQAIDQSHIVLAAHWDNIRIAFVASGITTPFADWLTENLASHNLLTLLRAAFATQWRQIEESGSREAGRRRSSARRLGLAEIWLLYLWFGASVQSQRCWRQFPPDSEFSARELFLELCRVRGQQPLGKQKHYLEKSFGPREFEAACSSLTDRKTMQERKTRDDQTKEHSHSQRQAEEESRKEEERVVDQRKEENRRKNEEYRQVEDQQKAEEQQQADEQDRISETGRIQRQMQQDDSGYFDGNQDTETEQQDHDEDDDSGFGSWFDSPGSLEMGAQASMGASEGASSQESFTDMNDPQNGSEDTDSSPEKSTDADDPQRTATEEMLSAARLRLAEVRDDCAVKKSQWQKVSQSEASIMLQCKNQIDARVTLIMSMEADVEDVEEDSSTVKIPRGLGDLEQDLKAAVSRKRKATCQIKSLTAKSQRLMESEKTMLALVEKAVEEHLGRVQGEEDTIVGPGEGQ